MAVRVALFDPNHQKADAAHVLEAAAIVRALGVAFVTDLRNADIIVLRSAPASPGAALLLRCLQDLLPSARFVRSEWLRASWETRALIATVDGLPKASGASDIQPKLFQGVRVCIGAFEDEKLRAYCAAVLQSRGAHLTDAALPHECNYVLLPYGVSATAHQTIPKVPLTVTPFWLHDSIAAAKLLPPEGDKLHRPVVRVKGMERMRISCTNYDNAARELLRRQILAAGAVPDFTLTKQHTHLLTPLAHDMHTRKCLQAKAWAIPLVTADWLLASLNATECLPIDAFAPPELPRMFVFPGNARPEASVVALLRELGADVAERESNVPVDGTVYVMKKLRRSERFLAACAAGSWIVKESYMEQTVAKCALANEAEHEWGESDACSANNIWLGAPRRWRLYRQAHPQGAFAHKRVLVLGELPTPPSSAVVASLLRIAGAEVLPWPLPSDTRPDFALVAPVPDCEPVLKELTAIGVPCFHPQAIADVFSHDTLPPIAQHLTAPL